MNNAPRNLLLFVGALLAGFVYICNAIPQVESNSAGAEITIGETPEELVTAGKAIFASDRAQCLTCHALSEDPKARCPNMDGLGERALSRKSGVSAADYLVESIYDPNAFVVPGYPKNQMTPVHRPPIALNHDEILAVASYLNSLGGQTDQEFVDAFKKTQDPWRKGLLTPDAGSDEEAKIAILPGDASAGDKIFRGENTMCIKCHRIGEEGADVGPELTTIGGSQGAEYLLASILDPSAVIVKGYTQTTVMLDELKKIQGVPIQWIPSKEQPLQLKLGILEGGELKEQIVELADVASVGDTIVGYDTEEDYAMIAGELVSGDVKTGVTLRVLEKGKWVEKRIESDVIDAVSQTISPMPNGLADQVNPREMFDLLAFLLAQKGKP